MYSQSDSGAENRVQKLNRQGEIILRNLEHLSGSTAWRSMVRSLWTLKAEQREGGNSGREGSNGKKAKQPKEGKGDTSTGAPLDQKPAWTRSTLTLDKSNYGPSGTQIRLHALADNDNPTDYLAAWGSPSGFSVSPLIAEKSSVDEEATLDSLLN